MSRAKVTPAAKVHYVDMYRRGEKSGMALARIAGVAQASFQQWVRNYDVYGPEAFTMVYQHYPDELKVRAVQDYLSGKGSQDAVCKKYGIRSKSKLNKWIMEYNGHEELSQIEKGRSNIVTKGRKTSFEDRVEIVEDCLSNGRNYAETSRRFSVSYNQIYTWVRKYEQKGINGLKDGRGRNKPESEMSELEHLRYENRMQRAQLLQKQMEIDFLKKLQELERR